MNKNSNKTLIKTLIAIIIIVILIMLFNYPPFDRYINIIGYGCIGLELRRLLDNYFDK